MWSLLVLTDKGSEVLAGQRGEGQAGARRGLDPLVGENLAGPVVSAWLPG